MKKSLKALKTVVLSSLVVVGLVGGVSLAQGFEPKSTVTVTATERPATAPTSVEPVLGVTTGKLEPWKNTYVFGSVGSTTNGKSSTVTTLGIGHDTFKFNDGHVILGFEGALTHFTGKRLNTLNNEAHGEYGVVDKKNMLELGAKLSYQFNELDPINARLYGKAGIATTSAKSLKDISPYVGAGVEFNVKNQPVVFDLGIKHYTDLRKAKVYYAQDSGTNFNTRKDQTVIAFGVQYRF